MEVAAVARLEATVAELRQALEASQQEAQSLRLASASASCEGSAQAEDDAEAAAAGIVEVAAVARLEVTVAELRWVQLVNAKLYAAL